ncbi:MAG: Arm DNA-binding domain-containing protein [Halofilum sp. (in: g-proteobacteria)]|nr:Arm DNA-binding domain-containing protein [Halofilum sp. (in: g-proteobacteria)]
MLRVTIDGKRREMGFQRSFPDVGLAEARDKATECRKLAKEGIDPIVARQTEPEKTPTFTTCAARYVRAHRRGWKNTKHARQWVSTLKNYARPEIGSKKVDTIVTEDILKILSPSGPARPRPPSGCRGGSKTSWTMPLPTNTATR